MRRSSKCLWMKFRTMFRASPSSPRSGSRLETRSDQSPTYRPSPHLDARRGRPFETRTGWLAHGSFKREQPGPLTFSESGNSDLQNPDRNPTRADRLQPDTESSPTYTKNVCIFGAFRTFVGYGSQRRAQDSAAASARRQRPARAGSLQPPTKPPRASREPPTATSHEK